MKEALKDIFEKLTDEQKEKAKACKNEDELMNLLGEWEIELPDELVDNVAGGFKQAHQSSKERFRESHRGLDKLFEV